MKRIVQYGWMCLTTVWMIGCGVTRSADNLVGSREMLPAEEIARTPAQNAFDAIRLCRPAFFLPPGEKSFGESDRFIARPQVYLNGVFYGEVESLRDIAVAEIRDIRYLEPMDATQKYGSVHPGGAIEVTTKLN